jgi:hypothetical protein
MIIFHSTKKPKLFFRSKSPVIAQGLIPQNTSIQKPNSLGQKNNRQKISLLFCSQRICNPPSQNSARARDRHPQILKSDRFAVLPFCRFAVLPFCRFSKFNETLTKISKEKNDKENSIKN